MAIKTHAELKNLSSSALTNGGVIDFNEDKHYTLVLTENVTLSLSNASIDKGAFLRIGQGGSGNYTLTITTNGISTYGNVANDVVTIDLTLNSYTLVGLWCFDATHVWIKTLQNG